MPKVYSVKKCRKSPGKCGKCGTTIEKGSPYVYWAFMVGGRGGPTRIRCGGKSCYPRPSELTQSEFWSTVLSLQESGFSGSTIEELESSRDEVVTELTNLKDEFENRKTEELESRCEEIRNELDEVLGGISCS